MDKPRNKNDMFRPTTNTGDSDESATRRDSDDADIAPDIKCAGIALSSAETVNRHGSANAEFIKGYRGIDSETGQRFAKGLAGIAEHKVNPEYAAHNIKQQAGYAAEVATTSRDNAEAIIQRSEKRTWRSDDLPQYGKNHNVVDRVQVLNGEIVEGSQAQMKFVGNREQLFERIAAEDGKFARYRGIKLELPSEQFEGAAQECRETANKLRQQADVVERNGNSKQAEKLRRKAENYDQLADNVTDSGLTTEQAIFYREHPVAATALDIARTSHRAGLEGARYGAIIGGSISLLQNMLAAAQGKKEAGDAARDLAIDTAKAGALGYGSAFAGAAIKGGMQQSGRQAVRTLANTNAPALAVAVVLSLGGSVKRYVADEISEAEFLVEVGEKGAGMLSAGMMSALGQLAIPIPFVGAAIGGMIGYTLSSLFYQSALEAAQGAEISRKRLARTQAIQEAARARIAEEQSRLDAFISHEIPQLQQATQQLFSSLATEHQSADAVAAAVNQFATLLGKRLEFQSIAEFDDFMCSDRPLQL